MCSLLSVGWEFCRKPSARCWEIVEVTRMCSACGKSLVAQIWSPSSSGSSGNVSGSRSEGCSGSGVGSSSLSSASSTKAGSGPVRQKFICRTSSFFSFCSSFLSAWQPAQQRGRHLVILTVPAWKSISRLCLWSQVKLRIILCFPAGNRQQNAFGMSWYIMRTSTTSCMLPASLGVPSIL